MSHRLMILAAALVLVTVACSTKQYIISTKEGRMLEAHGKPSFDDKTGMYNYKDSDGKAIAIRKDDVVQILER
jgi:hypothetical protein